MQPHDDATFLAEASAVLASSLDYEGTVARVVDLCVPSLSDWCAVDILDDGGGIRRVAEAHSPSGRWEFGLRWWDRFPPDATIVGSVAHVIATGKRSLAQNLTHEALAAAIDDPDKLKVVRDLGIVATLCVPLSVGGRILGALTFAQAESHRGFDETHLSLADELAHRAAIAIDNARLYGREREARAAAERLAAQMRRLQQVTIDLAAATSSDAILDLVIDHGVRAVGASTGAVFLLTADGKRAEVARSVGYSTVALRRFGKVTLDMPTPLGEAIRKREPVFLGSREAYAARYAVSEQRTRAEADGIEAVACLPLLSHDRVMGGLVMGFYEPRSFREDERAFLDVLAHHSAEALRRAHVIEQERRYRERLTVLTEAGDLLTRTLDYEATLRSIVHLALPVLADFSFLDVVEAPGEVRRIPDAFDDPRTLALLEKTRWVPSHHAELNLCGLSTGRTGVHPVIDDAWLDTVATGPEHRDLLKELRLCSMITVPLLSHGERLGALTLCFGASGRRHTDDDVILAEELARRAAQAVRHARLYLTAQRAIRRAEEAARQAEDASRLKDEFLATVSHELRTPLSAILGWSALLQGDKKPEPHTIAKAIEVIERNARSQQRIIEDILDVSRIVRGELRIESKPVDLEYLSRDVLDSVRPSARARGIALHFTGCDGPCRLVGDPERLRQILWNLLSNAVKFTPHGGQVGLSIANVGGKIAIRVRDTGKGIEPAFLPHVFERFRQADSTTTRSHGGLGLGLAIVRHLAEMHGGTVAAESPGIGHGSTFTVTLPVKPFVPTLPERQPSVHPVDADAPSGGGPSVGALRGIRILVVEDEEDARDLIQTLLMGEGAEVTAVGSATAALDVLNIVQPDMVISDIGMPGRDGYWLMSEIRKLRPHIPAVALTAFSREEDIARAKEAGFDRHVAKPVDPDDLVRMLAQALPTRG